MSRILLIITAGLCLPTSAIEARLFYQTYGSIAPAPDGVGCVWNANQDFFVPRYCDSGRYGLHGACTTTHAISAACLREHPIYRGYCTAYGACRTCWRDHVYASHCGCEATQPLAPLTLGTPCTLNGNSHAALGCSCGPKHAGSSTNARCCQPSRDSVGVCSPCCSLAGNGAGECCAVQLGGGPWRHGARPYIEPLGGDSLGKVPLIGMGALSGGGGGLGGQSLGGVNSIPGGQGFGPSPLPGAFPAGFSPSGAFPSGSVGAPSSSSKW